MRRYVRVIAPEAFVDASGHGVEAGEWCVLERATGRLHCLGCDARRRREERLAGDERAWRGRYGR